MEIGDLIELTNNLSGIAAGERGQIKGIDCGYYAVEFERNIGGHDCNGKTKDGHGMWLKDYQIRLVRDNQRKLINGYKLSITANGDTTIAKLIVDGKCVKAVSVKRYYKDEFNAEIAAKEAISKLFKPAGYTGKAVYYNDNRYKGFTKGKIYNFRNGDCIDDKGKLRSAESFADLFDEYFVKIKE